jgi:hypothetical protein
MGDRVGEIAECQREEREKSQLHNEQDIVKE